MIIDFHAHTFPDAISKKVLTKLSRLSHTKYFTDGSVGGLLSSMQEAGITYSVNLPVMTGEGQVEKVNSALIDGREGLLAQGIVTFGGMHPDYGNYKAELLRLKNNGILGIKIHPAYQNTDIDDIRMLRIIDCAAELGLIVLTHAGIDIGIYDHNYSSVRQILSVIDKLHPEKFVLAHMGNWGCWDEVERDLAGADVYFDTAFDEAFLRIVRKHGADKILFATDSPWESQKDYVGRMQKIPLSETEQEQIFAGNAKRLLML